MIYQKSFIKEIKTKNKMKKKNHKWMNEVTLLILHDKSNTIFLQLNWDLFISFQDKMHTGTDGYRHVTNEIAIEGEKWIFQHVEKG